jgi:hypothetical protein
MKILTITKTASLFQLHKRPTYSLLSSKINHFDINLKLKKIKYS